MREIRKTAGNSSRANAHASREALEAPNVREIRFEGSKTCAKFAKQLETALARTRTLPARLSRPQTCAKLALKARKHARNSQNSWKQLLRERARFPRGFRGPKRARNWL